MSKERLEEIVEKITEQTFDRIIVPQTKITIKYQDIKFLINAITKQDERVQELEEQKLALIEEMGQVDERFLDLEQQNKKLREALEFYANRERYWQPVNTFNDTGYDESIVQQDEGKMARKALEGEE